MLRLLVMAVGVAASLVLLAVSAGMNYRFGYSLGRSAEDGLLLGAASAAVDGLKAVLPLLIGYAAARARIVAVMAGIAAWGLFTAYSLTSAVGFSAQNRSDISRRQEIIVQAYRDARGELDRLKSERAALGTEQPPAALQAELKRLAAHPRWQSSKACEDATVATSRRLCANVRAIEARLARARRLAEIEHRLSEMRARLAVFKDGAGVSGAHAQTRALSAFSGLGEGWVRAGLVGLLALVTEIGSGLGLYLALQAWREPSFAGTLQQGRGAEERATIDRPKGRVEGFCRACLTGGQGPGLSLDELYQHYRNWCTDENLGAETREEFRAVFGEIGQMVGLSYQGGRYGGLALKERSDGTGFAVQTVAA